MNKPGPPKLYTKRVNLAIDEKLLEMLDKWRVFDEVLGQRGDMLVVTRWSLSRNEAIRKAIREMVEK